MRCGRRQHLRQRREAVDAGEPGAAPVARASREYPVRAATVPHDEEASSDGIEQLLNDRGVLDAARRSVEAARSHGDERSLGAVLREDIEEDRVRQVAGTARSDDFENIVEAAG